MSSPTVFSTSGDWIADRRFAAARALAEAGDVTAAADLLAQALAIVPAWAAGWFVLGEWRERLGQPGKAVAAYRAALAHDERDALGAALRLALIDGTTPEAMSAAYVGALFDAYAPRFDAALTGRLGYAAPALIAAALARGGERRFGAAIDLGCGTGLMGIAIRDRVDRLTGVDLSEGMLKATRRKAIYDRLVAGDAIAALGDEPESSADLIVAADMVPYVGGLGPLFAAVARVLTGGGTFAFTAERHHGDGFILGEKLRFRHSAPAIAEAAATAGMALADLDAATLRLEAGVPVAGYVCALARPADVIPLTPKPVGGGPVLPQAA
jgi:predicted TPR repeat methyltransferase